MAKHFATIKQEYKILYYLRVDGALIGSYSFRWTARLRLAWIKLFGFPKDTWEWED